MTVLSVALFLGACASGASSPAPITEQDAIRLVLAQDERFAGIGPLNPDLIGQAAWYEVAATEQGWQVRVRIGWGDCPTGCINEHTWTYAVSRTGEVELLREEGDTLDGETGVRGVVVAGPTCPVETIPPDPDCAEQPVEEATLLILDESGNEVARATSAADGTFSLTLAPGSYRLVPQPIEGLMGTALELAFEVQADEPAAELTVAYDTGIR